MPLNCIVPGCKNRFRKGTETSFHRFPKDRKTAEIWFDSLNLRQRDLPSYPRVCGWHFPENSYVTSYNGKQKLKSNAIPEIIPPRLAKKKMSIVIRRDLFAQESGSTMMSMNERKRFSSEEIDYLKRIFILKRDILENKLTDMVNVTKKKKCWQEIADEFNNKVAEDRKRTSVQLNKLYDNLKTKKKKELAKAQSSDGEVSECSFVKSEDMHTVDVSLGELVTLEMLNDMDMSAADSSPVDNESTQVYGSEPTLGPSLSEDHSEEEEIELHSMESVHVGELVEPVKSSRSCSSRRNESKKMTRQDAMEVAISEIKERNKRLMEQDKKLYELKMTEAKLKVEMAKIKQEKMKEMKDLELEYKRKMFEVELNYKENLMRLELEINRNTKET